MSKFYRLTNGLEDRGTLLPVTTNAYDKIKQSKDYYVSLYRYEDRHLEHFKKTHSIAGITDVTTPKILFDFDDNQNIEKARKDALTVCARLVEHAVPEDKLRIYFSGNKGFNVEVMTDQEFTRQEFVNIVGNLAGDLETFDEKINNESRVIRAPLTKHPKSGYYKIPLSLTELASLSLEEIKHNADGSKIHEYLIEDQDDNKYQIALPDALKALKKKEYKRVAKNEVKVELTFDIHDIDFTKCPKWMAKERYALQEGFFYGSESAGKGERNTAFMILAATYRGQGFSADHALSLLLTTAGKQAERTKEAPYTESQLQNEVINVVYSPSWKGGIYGRDEELLQLTRQRFKINEELSVKIDLVGIDDVGTEFKDFAKNIDRNTIKTGLKTLDENVLITSGMMVSLLAAPGAGKTSFANTFVEQLSLNQENTVYFSLDMYKNLLFSRLLQRYSGYDMRKILHMFKEDKPDGKLVKAYAEVLKNYSNVSFNFRSGPTVEEIEQEVVNFKLEKGKDVKLVVVDYLEKVRGPFSDATANSAYVASRLSDIAKKHHTTVLLLVQPQKSAGDPREELTSYRKIKGASVIEQDSRVILTLTRPGYDPKNMDDDRFATISVVKNNMGNLCQLDFGWDGVSGSLNELDADGRAELKSLRDQLAEAKAKLQYVDL
jgi:KaiC/GvpD/RAD55 family RecA-like ATPase